MGSNSELRKMGDKYMIVSTYKILKGDKILTDLASIKNYMIWIVVILHIKLIYEWWSEGCQTIKTKQYYFYYNNSRWTKCRTRSGGSKEANKEEVEA